uniref:Uncharacterized protein TCIL3000_3_310 n=1 Tax=Trypanosoma congolense (strain IL3000) TaxID=1068625 RepID=G0UJR4_TRYCI|nr:unnamed protein product [Trypanosoma congolense IL3000]
MTFSPLSRRELEEYLPNFDPLLDPQIGEWVLVTPRRRVTLLGPLLQRLQNDGLQPVYPFLAASRDHFRAPLNASLLCAEEISERAAELPRVLPSIGEVWRRHQYRRLCAPDSDADGMEEDDTVLYLNPRALLLTPSAPVVFGGSDFIEGFDRENGCVVYVNWKTGESSTDSAVLRPAPIPTWAESVSEKAAAEWDLWWRRVNSEHREKGGHGHV